MSFFYKKLVDYTGIGSEKYKLFRSIGIHTDIDLLFHIPRVSKNFPIYNQEDLLKLVNDNFDLNLLGEGKIFLIKDVFLSLLVKNIKKNSIQSRSSKSKKQFYLVHCDLSEDFNCPSKNIEISTEIIYFHINSLRTVYTTSGVFRGSANIKITRVKLKTYIKISFVHPDFFSNLNLWSETLNLYSLTDRLHNNDVIKVIKQIKIPEFNEWIPDKIVKKYRFDSWQDSIRKLHTNSLCKEEREKCIARLACDELIYHNLTKKKHFKNNRFFENYQLKEKFLEASKIHLTKSQANCLLEINSDLSSGYTMFRLLHGDVGSGKTIVAFLSIINVVSSKKYQAAFIAPTEVLALQHYSKFAEILKISNIDIRINCLTGSTKEKKLIKSRLKDGEIEVIFGTHALFEDNVEFNNLQYVVIDEQHKFGVKQRSAITSKGDCVNVLVMSATPIPRTLEHAINGYLDISKISEKIPGRVEVKTYIISSKTLDVLIERIISLINMQFNGYWVCPSIENNEDMISVKERYDYIKKVFVLKKIDSSKIGMLHGDMSSLEKNDMIEKFKKGEVQLLISTTVIEIGIDVPTATFITIENSERFGLSQLHQLRGRVGRNNINSYCFLVYDSWNKKIWNRLNILKNSNDGFLISEKDLLLRGGGEFYGTNQSGDFSIFNFVDYEKHKNLISDIQSTLVEIEKNENIHFLMDMMSSIKSSQ